MTPSLLDTALNSHSRVHTDLPRSELIRHVLERREAIETDSGALATWVESDSTRRRPTDTFIVQDGASVENVDWDSPAANPISPEKFETLWQHACDLLGKKSDVFVAHHQVGADSRYALPVRTISDRTLSVLFADNMFRAVDPTLAASVLADKNFDLLVLPWDRIDPGTLRPDGDAAVVMDFENNRGLILGSAYLGSIKKLLFTVMNYHLPTHGILPLHCSANLGSDDRSALLLGLSGTGKTTLSADATRALIGDDECGWGDDGVANFENGCYAKLIDLDPEREPEIYRIAFGETQPVHENGVIIENAMMYPDGRFDLHDRRLTANSRTSYPLSRLQNFVPDSRGGHPRTILFLTADANGVLPPVARLDEASAMLWFLMGYTSKLAGTETGITEPRSTFSRFFGEPFMPRHPEDYAQLLREKMTHHGTDVFLINTGWSGGPYGTGSRMDIHVTRAIVEAALSGALHDVEYRDDTRFRLAVPTSCPGVDAQVLNPKNTWDDPTAFELRADRLAADFATHFEKNFAGLSSEIRAALPCTQKKHPMK